MLPLTWLATAAGLPGVTDTVLATAIEAMNNGYARCFKVVYLATLGFGIPGIIASFFVSDVSSHFTNEVQVDLDEPNHGSNTDEKV